MPSSTVEDYVKSIYALQRDNPNAQATVAQLAAALGITKGSVTAMVRKLRDAGLAEAERYGGIALTPKGRELALDVVRRHRIIELFLVDVLRFDWAEVHEEAERLEHAMSARLLDRLDEYLGRPETDPHGDPIPDATGRIAPVGGVPLSGLAQGDKARIARVSDRDPTFLEFAAKHGLRPGASISVIEVVPEAEAMKVKARGRDAVGLALRAAERITVEPDAPDQPD